MKTFNVAVIGATGAVGEAMLSILAERDFPTKNVYAIASERSAGSEIAFKEQTLVVEDLAQFDFHKADIALFSAGGKVSAEFAPRATKAGCIVIDNSPQFRYEKDVPLVIPEVNPQALAQYKNRHIIANPNCSVIQMIVALNPIYAAAGITRINVATYQSVSGAGRSAIEELAAQTVQILNGHPIDELTVFPKQIAFNVIPQINDFHENGYSLEEMKIILETRKILEDDTILVNPTAARVPVFYGHSEAVHLETRKKLTASKAKELLQKAPGVKVIDERTTGGYPTAVSEAAGTNTVFVGRIREDISHEKGLDLWIVSDNIRKGAALNAVQIAEEIVKMI